MARKKDEEEMYACPVGSFFADVEKIFGKKSKFFEHLGKSQAEFLKAVRSLIDEKIEGLEKKGAAGAGRKRTKIKVE
jgi:hypothetical protein